MTFVEFLAWFTVVGLPILALTVVIWLLVRRLRKTKPISQPYAYTPPPPAWTETKTTITTTQDPPNFADLEIDEKDWDDKYPGETQQDEFTNQANLRVYRVYRSTNRKEWVECDPVLTERAACNYAAYIKANNPKEYVRCEDPDGLILFYE